MTSKNPYVEKIKKSLNNPSEPGVEYIAQPQDYEQEILQGYKMEVLKYGFGLDNFCPYKQGQLTVVVGHYNLGKTTVILWLLAKLAKQGKKILIYSAENRISLMHKNVTRFFTGHPDVDHMALEAVRPYFMYIKHERRFSYMDMLNQGLFVLDAGFDFDIFFIDPYNALKMDNPQRLGGHEYHLEAIEEMRVFTITTNKSIFLNCHTVTESQREKPDANGHTPVPLVSSVEGGGKFPNKADDAIVIHRQIHSKDEDERYVTEIHVGKVRNQEFGGRPTPWGDPVKIKFRKDWTGFDPLYSTEQKIRDYKQLQFIDEPKRNGTPF